MSSAELSPAVARWYATNTFLESPSLEEIATLKRALGERVSVCLPALNEGSTIGSICRSIVDHLMDATNLVDELVVVDSGSEDGTVAAARNAGATVHRVGDILSDHLGSAYGMGKGEALWRSLAVVDGDIVVWLDSDTRNFDPSFVSNLIAPLIRNDQLALCKAFYERPLGDHATLASGGARVTELVVRPLLNMFWPQLTGLIQPLSGEYAVRREVALDLPFFTGYGVEIGLLLDISARIGLDAVGQADLGRRVHRNQDIAALGRMSHQILQVMLKRLEGSGTIKLASEVATTMTQFRSSPGAPEFETFELEVVERPPARALLLGLIDPT